MKSEYSAASVGPGDGGAWLDGDAARAIVCDAMTIPVVTGDIDPSALEDLIAACARYRRIRAEQAAGQNNGTEQGGVIAPAAPPAGTTTEVLAMLEHQILANVLQVVSGPGGVASFLRRNLLGKGLNGPSLPLDVGQPRFVFCACDLRNKLSILTQGPSPERQLSVRR
jgi:hypothetical protein